MPCATPSNVPAVCAVLSAPRMGTYLAAAGGDQTRAVELYGWNARISSALMLPAHFAEVSTRNAVDDALTAKYGSLGPWNATFEQSLPDSGGPAFNARRNLRSVRAVERSTGKVIAELKFVFWQTMFTARHDQRLWNRQIAALFPHADTDSPQQLRARIYDDLETIRRLRNRIAHHEPIFARDLADDLAKMVDLCRIRSAETARWVRTLEDVTATLAERP